MHVLQREAAGVGGAQAPLAVNIVGGEAGAVGLDQEATDLAAFVLIFSEDNGHVGDGSGGDPELFAVEDVLVADLAGGGGHGSGIGACARLRKAEAAELFATG